MASEDYYTAAELQKLTGTPSSTWRFWARYHPERGPASTRLGRRSVWKKTTVHAWLDEQEKAGRQPK
jgi:prophage regulatory protein